jgi:hypothetical protein
MAVAPEDQALYGIVSGTAPTTIDEVIARMHSIDAIVANEDGLKWFNRLYLMVTEEVDLHPPASGWKDSGWLLTLDVIFAGMYLRAVAEYLNGEASVPGSWRALMEARHRPGVDRIQFALAGMNAHINRDLALALVATNAQRNVIPALDSPQHRDYEAVNGLLNTVMPSALTMLASDTLGVLAQDTGKVGRLLAFWDICKARELAWGFGNSLRGLPSVAQNVAMVAQDQMTGVIGRAILSFS